MARKVKITRKQIRQDDAFLHAMKEVTGRVVETMTDKSFYHQYRLPIFGALAGIVVVAVVAAGVFGYAAWQANGAVQLMAEADNIYRAPVLPPEQYKENAMAAQLAGAYTDAQSKWSAAAEKYDAVSNSFGGTDAGILALFFAGNSYYELADYAEAAARFESYVAKAGAGAPFAPLAKQSMGYAYEALGQLDKAETMFLDGAKSAGATTSFLALFDLARIYEKQDKIDQAIETLKKIETTEVQLGPQVNQLKQRAKSKISMLESRLKKTS